ncbi:MAG: hypothetical protein EOO05_10970 [Chitinophagaceae bacterium]|nr:MAG: hypothetical protein EOO05_10970 [Chitinophagaceae bacterium]
MRVPNWRKNYLSYLEISLIVLLAAVPLFVTFPYRVNIFLSWEGAYRISEGELPFRDFGTPLGGMYWVIPAFFFKIFGPQMITLVKAQVFINILSGLAFRSILKSLGVQPGIRAVSVLVYVLSFSFFNFWPWYNHTVIVYEFLALACLLRAIRTENRKAMFAWMAGAGLFTVCSFLTKQDAGGMCLGLGLLLLGYNALNTKKWIPLFTYIISFVVILLLFIGPFLSQGFGYWFNHGQAPHTARISFGEIIAEFLGSSQWIKFYLFLILVLVFIKGLPALLKQRNEVLFLLLAVGVIGEAAIFQVTSYTPPDNNIFFHSFAIAYILHLLSGLTSIDFNRPRLVLVTSIGVLLWWSNVYWKYIQRVTDRAFPVSKEVVSSTGENVVNRKTYILGPVDSTEIPVNNWVFSSLPVFKNIYMPKETVDGINRIMSLDVIKNKKDLSVLNMSELTPLAAAIPYQYEKGTDMPLWYHLGVGMFNKQAEMFEKKISDKQYDLVLFEYLPRLNNFYPFRVRDTLMNHYNKIDSFEAPRRGDTRGTIEVYQRR